MQKQLADYPSVLDVSDIQEILSIGRLQAYQLVHSGAFRIIKVGKRIKIPRRTFTQWLEGDNDNALQ